MKDFRYALRQLLRQPGFTILAVVALALGIGANTVLFSAINTLFLRPLSYPRPEQLVRVWGSFPERGLDRAVGPGHARKCTDSAPIICTPAG